MKFVPGLALFAALAVAGCSSSSGPNLEGTWRGGGPALDQQGGKLTMTFGKPNTTILNMEVSQGQMQFGMTGTGTYTLSDNKLKTTMAKLDIDLSKVPAQAQALVKGALDEKKLLKQMNDEPPATLKWDGNDSFTLSGEKGGPVTFTRQK